ncbi:hypothetical protein H072_10880 [Dactylellina haptotyla CBS 200.50]|uniref:Phytocyanin domain-containing protein n=1 Tax=Dactylellina haptotyla (strain CBS 200.50) TaxID=1284197 RepID=S8BKC6_DACHA|nr:hypothetical protein H072_10880 [Dactylellina haptotyla CBS 200.50]
MFKSILAASVFVSTVLGTQYGYPDAAYSQASGMPQYTTVAPASTTCTQNAVVHTAPPMQMAPPSQQTGAPMIHKVVVGGDAGLIYTPEFIYAAIGDIVEFHFMKQNHSVTQSTFAKPCVRKPDGIDSGLMPNPNNTIVPAPVFKYQVDTTEASWWYCKQRTGTHCGKGMTFAINPTPEKPFDAFKSMAIAQNGTATAAPTEAPAAVVSSTITMVAGSPTDVQSAPSAVATTVDGNGNGSAGSCQCQCFCGVAAYPSGYGINNFGGMPGALPAPWATTSAAAAAVTSAAAGGYYKR